MAEPLGVRQFVLFVLEVTAVNAEAGCVMVVVVLVLQPLPSVTV